MTESLPTNEIAERLNLIESMMAEGRRKVESWSWTFLLWGVAYYIAFFWGGWGHGRYAWPITMLAAGALTMFIVARRRASSPATTLSRAIGSIWAATGCSLFIVLCSLGYSGRLSEAHSMIAIFAAMLGLANAASALTLRWKAQMLCAIVWWAAAVVACYCTGFVLMVDFLAAVFIGQIVFGIYGMYNESQRRARSVAHA